MATPLPLDTSVFFKLVRVVNLIARPFLETVGKQHHLSLNEWRVMVVLASHPGVSATDVAESTGLDKMSVSRALGALERRGRLLRKDNPDDQRKSRLYLSAQGKRLFGKIGIAAKKREAELFRGVQKRELDQLGATLDKLIGALREQGP